MPTHGLRKSESRKFCKIEKGTTGIAIKAWERYNP